MWHPEAIQLCTQRASGTQVLVGKDCKLRSMTLLCSTAYNPQATPSLHKSKWTLVLSLIMR